MGRGGLKIVTLKNGKEVSAAEAERLRFEAAVSLKVSRILEDRGTEKYKPFEAPDRPSVRRAMDAVETRLVEALWTLARLPGGDPFGSGSCGLDYIQESSDRFANAVANGGKWEDVTPRPARPSSRAIDSMDEPLEWLSWLPRDQAKLVSTAASTKRGDVDRNVSWGRVRSTLPQLQGQTIRTLQRRYEGGIRSIASDLSGGRKACR